MDQVRDWMTAEVLYVEPQVTAGQALVVMNAGRVRHVLVRSGGDGLAGILSDRDFVRAALVNPRRTLDLEAVTVEDIMTPSPLMVVQAEASVTDAARLLHENRISALPVLHEEEVVGILTTSDLLRSFFVGVEAPLE